MHDDVPMWTYWCLEEGTLGVDPELHRTNDGKMPPVIHVDTDAPLYSDVDGSLITDKLWGIYYKPDFNFGGIQGGAMPFKVEADPDEVAVDPYGPEVAGFRRRRRLRRYVVLGAGLCQKRFEGKMPLYKKESHRAASAASRPTISRCSTCSATMSMSSPIPTTATR